VTLETCCLETFDQSYEESWPEQHFDNFEIFLSFTIFTSFHKFYNFLKVWLFLQFLNKLKFSYICTFFYNSYILAFFTFHNFFDNFHHIDNCKYNPEDLWYLRHWWQFWQIGTWIHEKSESPKVLKWLWLCLRWFFHDKKGLDDSKQQTKPKFGQNSQMEGHPICSR